MCNWGKLSTTKYRKDQNKTPTATSAEPGAKAGGREPKQGTAHAPLTHHHLRGGQTTSATPPARPLDTPPTLTPYEEPARPASGASEQGNLFLFSLPPAAAGAPVKPCLNFLSGL